MESLRWVRGILVAEVAERGWSMDQLAREVSREMGEGASVTRQSVHAWVQEETMPSVDNLMALARALGMQLDVMLTRVGDGEVAVRVPDHAAAIAREVGLLCREDLEAVAHVVERLRSRDPKVSATA